MGQFIADIRLDLSGIYVSAHCKARLANTHLKTATSNKVHLLFVNLFMEFTSTNLLTDGFVPTPYLPCSIIICTLIL
jgi:hypothetical protein